MISNAPFNLASKTILTVLLSALTICLWGKGFSNSPIAYTEAFVDCDQAASLSLDGVELFIPPNALSHDSLLSLTVLSKNNTPTLPSEVVNLSAKEYAYRFGPSGTQFQEILSLEIAYDPNLLPPNCDIKQISCFYFQPETGNWTLHPVDTILTEENKIRVSISHFTDFIAGVIQLPENPESSIFEPTQIKDLQAANPASEIVQFQQPQISHLGGNNLSFSFRLPKGRANLQPEDVVLQYTNEGSHSWVGLGWSLQPTSISIETRWGAPRYHSTLETETYTYKGEQLWPVAHRGDFVSRTSEKQFWPRIEKDFKRIIRHGDHPSNYWWEATDKEGTTYYFGGRKNTGLNEAAITVDQDGNVGQWHLSEVRDANDNLVRYYYRPGASTDSFDSNQLYLDSITYTGHGDEDGLYAILFDTEQELDEELRQDVNIDCRLGFVRTSAERLRRIEMRFVGQLIRSYRFEYEYGPFNKSLLTKLGEYGADSSLFYEYPFYYFNDIYEGNDFTPLQSAPVIAEAETGELSSGLDGGLISGIVGVPDNLTFLDGSGSKNRNIGGAVTVGPGPGPLWAKSNTYGVNFSIDRSESWGLASFTDINGDRLPDKVFRQQGQLWYRPNKTSILSPSVLRFGDAFPIEGPISFLNETKSKGNSKGAEANIPGGFFLGYTRIKSRSTTYTYTNDFNSDGLLDVARRGFIYFNTINGNGHPEFEPVADNTDSPIQPNASLSNDIIPVDTAGLAALIDEYPLHDIVRMWRPPYPGVIQVEAPVFLAPRIDDDFDNYEPKDGIIAQIQWGNGNTSESLWIDSIGYENYDLPQSIDFNSEESILIEVDAGDINDQKQLYFRLQSRKDGAYDQVIWDPIITYQSISPDYLEGYIDPDGVSATTFQASEDFTLFSKQVTSLPSDGVLVIDGIFSKPVSSDSLQLQIIYTDDQEVSSTVYARNFNWSETVEDELITDTLDVQMGGRIAFRINSSSNVDWREIDWQPRVYYNELADGSDPFDENGDPALSFLPAVDASIYSNTYRHSAVFEMQEAGQLTVFQQAFFPPTPNDEFDPEGLMHITVKGESRLYASRTVDFSDPINQMGNPILPSVEVSEVIPMGEKIYVTLSFTNDLFARQIASYLNSSIMVVNDDNVGSIRPGIFSFPDAEDFEFGPMVRHWGRFTYNGNRERAYEPINEDELEVDQPEDTNLGGAGIINNQHLSEQFDPSTSKFIIMYADRQNASWSGFDNLTYIKSDTMSSSRFGEDDVSFIETALQAGILAPDIKSVTTTNSFAGGVPLGGFSGSASYSTSNTHNSVEVIDMNGDGYPDMVQRNAIQYTLPTGGLSEEVTSLILGRHSSKATAFGGTLGGSFIVAKHDNSGNKGNGGSRKPQSAGNSETAGDDAKTTVGLSGNLSENNDEVESTWTDINGDGLPDRVFKNGEVEYNLGYRFSERRQWNYSNIRQGKSSTRGVGGTLGFNNFNRSISAGIGLSFSENYTKFQFQDINGDGLPDRLGIDTTIHRLSVQINQGHRFDTSMVWAENFKMDEGSSIGESNNFAFTVCIPIAPLITVIRICINPQGSFGKGVSRQHTRIMDVNGDSYPDLVESRNDDGDLRVRYSTTGRTNMLSRIDLPLGGSMTFDYSRTQNTYDNPNSQWTLTSVALDDGLEGDGPSTQRFTYTYENGQYNRHERRFYGFSEVVMQQHDTENDDATYRTTVQRYDNNTYYRQGLLLQQTTFDAQDTSTYVDKVYEYELRDVATGATLPYNISTDDGLAFPVKLSETTYFHEGETTPGLSQAITYDYDILGNITSYEDSGDGSPADWVKADITYHALQDRYIMAIPESISVNIDGQNGIRNRECTIDSLGNITEIRQELEPGVFATHNYQYDDFGNITREDSPANYKGQQMYYEYDYDPEVSTYVTNVLDAYGYESSSTYDYRFGQLLETTDINGQSIEYGLDGNGRISTITGPYELAVGIPYTIKMEYFPLVGGHPDSVSYALTRHYDPQHPVDDILTYTFMDGLHRPVQVKKTIARYNGDGIADSVLLQVSGKQIFDAFNRVVTQYYPTTQDLELGKEYTSVPDTIPPIIKTFDVLDRELSIMLPDGALTTMVYSIEDDNNGEVRFKTRTTDPLSNIQDEYRDVRNRDRARVLHIDGREIWTNYYYNPISELLSVADNEDNRLIYTYDRLGRKNSYRHPDAGLTLYTHDLADNLLSKQTPNIRALHDTLAIRYEYDHERRTAIRYPQQFQNNVTYQYGGPDALFNRAGRVWLQTDATGGQEFYYGPLGETTKTLRTVVVNTNIAYTLITESRYDTWNRIQEKIYPDGEVVSYHYNRGGKLERMDSQFEHESFVYLRQLGYDKFEQRVFTGYGNNTSSNTSYDPYRRRMINMRVDDSNGSPFTNCTYTYDPVDNITSLVNSVESAGTHNIGGTFNHTYAYDDIYRLESASGNWAKSGLAETYSMTMEYDDLHNIRRKTQSRTRNIYLIEDQNYDWTYQYEDENNRPHVTTGIGDYQLIHDANGNLTASENSFLYLNRSLYWDEENRLQYVKDGGYRSDYAYDANGNRVIKSHGPIQAIFTNGIEYGFVDHEQNYTVYFTPDVTLKADGFTKHYFAGGQRIASRIGIGSFSNDIYNPTSGVTAGQIDYAARIQAIRDEQERIISNNEPLQNPVFQNLPPYINPSNALDSTYIAIPTEWEIYLPLGPFPEGVPLTNPIYQILPPIRDSLSAGYGYNSEVQAVRHFAYFYHPDHLGSTGYVSNNEGQLIQHLTYLPFGETFVEEYTFNNISSTQTYLFNAKEFDRETGLYHYGARYLNPEFAIWLSVDAMAEKYPGWSPYNYTLQNPVKLVDPDGNNPALGLAGGAAIRGLAPIVQRFILSLGASKAATDILLNKVEENEEKKAEEKNKEQSFDDFFDDLPDGEKTRGRSRQQKVKEGDAETALEDFEDFDPENVIEGESDSAGKWKTGDLPDGSKLEFREKSSEGSSTLVRKIKKPNGFIKDQKIRYKPKTNQ